MDAPARVEPQCPLCPLCHRDCPPEEAAVLRCRHRFCQECIGEVWSCSPSGPYYCPECEREYRTLSDAEWTSSPPASPQQPPPSSPPSSVTAVDTPGSVESQCPLCHQDCNDPVTLQCKHGFCQECIKELWSGFSTGPYYCPECGQEYSSYSTFSDGASASPPSSFATPGMSG